MVKRKKPRGPGVAQLSNKPTRHIESVDTVAGSRSGRNLEREFKTLANEAWRAAEVEDRSTARGLRIISSWAYTRGLREEARRCD